MASSSRAAASAVFSRESLDSVLHGLKEAAPKWAKTSIAQRVAMLEEFVALHEGVMEEV